ncbi:MAG: gliding motility protein GldL [Bacteroidales bacterium]|nr:gliding motility protein GldL [Bacteroidales bacterium]
MSIQELVESPGYKKIMAYVYGWGAAVAIVGALFKIMHFPGAGVMLVAGLGVEALIFFLSAFEPPHAMPDWTLVYPELLGLDEEPDVNSSKKSHGNGGNGGGSELSALVSAGAIDQTTINQLSEGVKKLASTTSQMADLTDATSATKAYVNNVKVANDSLSQFAAAQSQVAEVGSKFSASSAKLADSIASQADLSEQLKGNMSAVNAAYVQQLAGLKGQAQSTEALASGLASISSEIAASVEGVKQYRQQIASLSKTVGELNSIYGNMLSAVTNR